MAYNYIACLYKCIQQRGLILPVVQFILPGPISYHNHPHLYDAFLPAIQPTNADLWSKTTQPTSGQNTPSHNIHLLPNIRPPFLPSWVLGRIEALFESAHAGAPVSINHVRTACRYSRRDGLWRHSRPGPPCRWSSFSDTIWAGSSEDGIQRSEHWKEWRGWEGTSGGGGRTRLWVARRGSRGWAMGQAPTAGTEFSHSRYTRLQTVWSLPGPSRQSNKGHSPRCHRRPNGPGRLADKVVQPTTQSAEGCTLFSGIQAPVHHWAPSPGRIPVSAPGCGVRMRLRVAGSGRDFGWRCQDETSDGGVRARRFIPQHEGVNW